MQQKCGVYAIKHNEFRCASLLVKEEVPENIPFYMNHLSRSILPTHRPSDIAILIAFILHTWMWLLVVTGCACLQNQFCLLNRTSVMVCVRLL